MPERLTYLPSPWGCLSIFLQDGLLHLREAMIITGCSSCLEPQYDKVGLLPEVSAVAIGVFGCVSNRICTIASAMSSQ